ncbi:MAG: hypothetical protein ACE5G9_10910 [Nitrospinales bacterium]
MTATVTRKLLGVLMAVGVVLLLTPAGAPGQQNEAPEFVNWGLISVSPKFTLGENARFIIFPIRNNATRSIVAVYAWIFEVGEDENGNATFRLANNPNTGGVLIKNKQHAPGTVADWRFSLVAANRPAGGGAPNFTLRVSPRGIFFARMEPQALAKSGP